MQIIDYYIVLSTRLKSLEKRVKEAMLDGWQPSGAHNMLYKKDGVYYTQTMVKHKNECDR